MALDKYMAVMVNSVEVERELRIPDKFNIERPRQTHATVGVHGRAGSSALAAEPASQAAKQKSNRTVTALAQMPDCCWEFAEHDASGIQYYTRVRVGLSTHEVMLDGGSSVNSVTEEIVLRLINENEAAGIVSDLLCERFIKRWLRATAFDVN